MKKFRLREQKILYGIPIAIFSFEIYLGILIGYFMANFCSPRINSLVFNIGSYKLHLHHWMLGLAGLILVVNLNFSSLPLYFSSGFCGGLIFQGVSCYKDWNKILVKNINNTI
ncbi:MAG: hypothetical protein ABIA08_02175 [bacterium]